MGLGFAIGAFPTLESDRQSGRIATPFDSIRAAGSTYYMLIPLDGDKPSHLRTFVDWLIAEGRSETV